MNKPATKEPSMDEILSSIRQIIADEDAGATAGASAAPLSSPPLSVARPVVPPAQKLPPLVLSPSQMIPPRAATPAGTAATAEKAAITEKEEAMPEPELVDPDDVTFEPDPEPAASVAAAPSIGAKASAPTTGSAEPAIPRPAASVSQAAPLPDPTLSADIAEQLLEPATESVVQSSMARLGPIAAEGVGNMTLDDIIRDMLRPMLKDWLDENLPALVERLVEKEIARISRGVK